MRIHFRRCLLGAVVAAGLTAICTAASAQSEPVKIGVILPIKTSGGQQSLQGAEMAAELINQQGGILGGRQVQLVVYDDNQQPVDGVAAAQRLLNQDKIKFIAGGYGSTVSLAVLQLVRASNALFAIAISKHPDLTSSGYDKVFRMNTPLDMDQAHDDKRVDEYAKPNKIAVVAENTDYGRYVLPSMKKYFGDRFVAGELVEQSLNDFSTVMTKIKGSGADTVCIVFGNDAQATGALRAMDALGLKVKKCAATGGVNNALVHLAGSAAEGLFASEIYDATVAKNALNEKFVRLFQAKFGRIPEKFEALNFETIWLIAKAMDAAGTATDTAKVAAALHKTAWQTPRGEVSFDAGGQASSKDRVNYVVKDGKIVAIE